MMVTTKMPMATIIKTIQGNTHQLLRRQMSSTAKVWVDKNTRVICQGFTGKQVSRKIEFQYRNKKLDSFVGRFCYH